MDCGAIVSSYIEKCKPSVDIRASNDVFPQADTPGNATVKILTQNAISL